MADNSHIVKSFFKQVNKSVENKTNSMTQIKSAIVHSVNLDGTVNITIPPSSTVYHNIQNQSIYRNLVPGDNVKIIKENNNLSNMWIMGGFGLQQIEEKQTSQSQLWEGDFSKTITDIQSTAKANSATIKLLTQWQSMVYNDISNISKIQQQADNNEASISLVVEGTGVNGKIKSASIIESINSQSGETSIKMNADKIDFTANNYSIDANKINFEVDDFTIGADKITFTSDDYKIISDNINLSGYVTFDNLKNNDEKTIINGSNITTGVIKSQNYISNFSGTSINLETGAIDTRYFKVDSLGKVSASEGSFSGKMTATEGSFSNCTIDNTCTIYGKIDVNSKFKVASDGSMTATAATISGDSRIGNDNLYINIGASSSGSQYNSFYLRSKVNEQVVDNVEIWKTSDDRAFIGGKSGIALGIIGNNTPVINITSDKVMIGQQLQAQNISASNLDVFDVSANNINAYGFTSYNGYDMKSSDGAMRGQFYFSTSNNLCIRDSSGFALVDKNGSTYLTRKYDQLLHSLVDGLNIVHTYGDVTVTYGKWRHNGLVSSHTAFVVEQEISATDPNGIKQIVRRGSFGYDGAYTCLESNSSSGVQLTCNGVAGLRIISNNNSTIGYLLNNWHSDTAMSVKSDRNHKNTIFDINNSDISDKYDILFDNIVPVTYKLNTDNQKHTHIGFIAQDVEEVINNTGLNNTDFGAVVIDNITNEDGSETPNYYLNYNDFIALNTWQIQQLKSRVAELEKTISALENKLILDCGTALED